MSRGQLLTPTCTRFCRCALAFCLALSASALGIAQQPAAAPAEEAKPEQRLFERDPFDVLVLKDGSTVEARPLDLPERRMPSNPRPGEKLRLRLVSEPDQLYEVPWREVVEVKFFEQLVLAEAERLLAAGEIDSAYDFFDYLERNYVDFPPLAASYQRFLLADATREVERGNLDYALVLFNELAGRNSQAEGLSAALGQLVDRIVARDLEQQDYRAAQAALAALQRRFAGHEVVARWQQELTKQADALAAQAQTQLAANHFPEANDLARRAAVVWPAADSARRVLAELAGRYPLVVVGVLQPAPASTSYVGSVPAAPLVDEWAARRARRLLARELAEFRGPGADGGEYLCPVGIFEARELGKQFVVQVRPGVRWPAGGGALDAFDIAPLLLARANTGQPGADLTWADLLARVTVLDALNVQADLRYTHLRPAALLGVPLVPRWQAGRSRKVEPQPMAGYRLGKQEAERTRFLSIDGYFAAKPTSAREIVERAFAKSSGALEALERGEISALDRVNPWDLPRLQAIEGIVVEPYAVPTVHCLVVNQRKPLLGQRIFRRGLTYALHREAILSTQLLRGKAVPGCQTISGPFPRGYAYNEGVTVRGYEPRLAMLLAEIGLKELEVAKAADGQVTSPDGGAKPPDAKPTEASPAATAPASTAPAPAAAAPADPAAASPPSDAAPAAPNEPAASPSAAPATATPAKFPELILVHPADEVARLACRAIERQLALIKIPVKLVALEPGAPQLPEDYDLAYVELQLWEPLVDAERLFGPGGLVSGNSPHVESALERLRLATDWNQARETLWELHALSADDAALIPLWQLTEHCAYRRELTGVGARPATLYQDVENWRATPTAGE